MMAFAGTLPDERRWILGSRLIYLQKKKGPAPRPVRTGEVWRRMLAKNLVFSTQKKLQQICLQARQLGVTIPGEADALIHFRKTFEEAVELEGERPVVILDLDLRNAFPSFEWDSIREAMAELLSDALHWTEWCHADAVPVYLPDRGVFMADRGAEQVDPLGSAYCALVLARTNRRAYEKLRLYCVEYEINNQNFWIHDI